MKNHNTSLHTVLTAGLLITLTTVVGAQDQQRVSDLTGGAPKGPSRIEIGAAFAQTLGASSFSSTQTVREYAEDGTLTSSYKVGKAPGAGFHVQYNLNKKFGIRVGGQTFSRKSDGTFSGKSPHPFFFNQQRSYSGTQNGLGFNESAFTLTAVLRGASGKWNFALDGGPAYFNVNATMAERATYTDTYPYDSVVFSSVATSKHKVNPIGLAMGVELGRELSDAVSVVVQGRYTGAKGSVDINGQRVDVKAGGVQARIGLRLIAARARAKS